MITGVPRSAFCSLRPRRAGSGVKRLENQDPEREDQCLHHSHEAESKSDFLPPLSSIQASTY